MARRLAVLQGHISMGGSSLADSSADCGDGDLLPAGAAGCGTLSPLARASTQAGTGAYPGFPQALTATEKFPGPSHDVFSSEDLLTEDERAVRERTRDFAVRPFAAVVTQFSLPRNSCYCPPNLSSSPCDLLPQPHLEALFTATASTPLLSCCPATGTFQPTLESFLLAFHRRLKHLVRSAPLPCAPSPQSTSGEAVHPQPAPSALGNLAQLSHLACSSQAVPISVRTPMGRYIGQ